MPPGFTVLSEDLSALVAKYKDLPKGSTLPILSRYELTGRQILVYTNNLQAGVPLTFSYRLQARFPLSAQTPASAAYDYYNPAVSGEKAPQRIQVQQP